MTTQEQIDEARDHAWRIWTRQAVPRCSETEQMALVFERWRREGWLPAEERKSGAA